MPIESARKIIIKVSKILSEIIEINQKHFTHKNHEEQKKPKTDLYTSIRDFLGKIFLNSNATFSVIIISMILIDRIVKEKSLFIDKENVFRLLSTSIGISMKLNLDYYNISEFPTIFNYSWESIKKNELEFLTLINNKLYVSLEEYSIYSNSLI